MQKKCSTPARKNPHSIQPDARDLTFVQASQSFNIQRISATVAPIPLRFYLSGFQRQITKTYMQKHVPKNMPVSNVCIGEVPTIPRWNQSHITQSVLTSARNMHHSFLSNLNASREASRKLRSQYKQHSSIILKQKNTAGGGTRDDNWTAPSSPPPHLPQKWGLTTGLPRSLQAQCRP